MASRTTTSGGDYDLSDPVNSFAEVVKRVVLQPSAFFARLPRQGGFLNPLVFALICTEISVLLVGFLGLIDVPGGFNSLIGARGDQGFLEFLGGLVIAPIAGAVGIFLTALVTHVLVVLVVGPGHSGNPGDARYDHRQGSARGIATGYLGALIGCGSGGRVGRLVLQGCLRAGTCPSGELPRVPLAYELPRISTLSSRQLGE